MSVTNPLLRELKGYATKLLTESAKPIRDEDLHLLRFCECFETILYAGIIGHRTIIGLVRLPECWFWLEQLGEERWGVPYLYSSCVEKVKKSAKVVTNRGKVRLLIRSCLVRRCLHTPLQFLVNEGRCCLLYSSNSVLGDSILTSVLCSLLSCLATLVFDLDLDNAMFLDSTWNLPTSIPITFVPAMRLGLSLLFVEGKAVIMDVFEDSVAAENGNIQKGDLLDSVNDVFINGNTQGSLSSLMKKSAGKPVSVYIVKGVSEGKLFPPVIPLYRKAGLDPALVASRDFLVEKEGKDEGEIVFLGSVKTGDKGDVKQIYTAINTLEGGAGPPERVLIECHHLGLRVVSLTTKQILQEHTYMEISSCGCSTSSPLYFAYIAGDINYAQCKNFVCYIFHSKNQVLVDSLLKTIGQGFRRTLFTV